MTEKGIETIKPREYSLKLSDADVLRIAKTAGAYDMTVSELLENFIGDIVNGTYTNGSDERMCAKQWAERCWFSHDPDKSLVKYLCDGREYEFSDLMDALEDIKNSFQSYMNEKAYEWNEEVKKAEEWYKENIAKKLGD